MARIRLFSVTLCALAALILASESHGQSVARETERPPLQAPSSSPAETHRLFPVEVKGRYGFMDASGRLLIAPKFDGGELFDAMTTRVLLHTKEKPRKRNGVVLLPNPTVGFIDRVGKLVFRGDSYFHNGKKVELGQIGPLSEDRAEVGVPDASTGYADSGYLDGRGNLVIAPQFGMTNSFSEGMAAVTRSGDYSWGYIDRSGVFAVQPRFRSAKPFSAGLAAVKDMQSELWGYVDKHGDYVIKPQFTDAWPFSEGYAVVEMEAGRFLIDRSGKRHGAPAPGLGSMAEGLIAFNEDGRHVNLMGWSKPHAATGGKWGYRNPEGEVILSPEFDFANDFSDGLAAVNFGGAYKDGIVQGGVWGYIDRTGRTVIAPQFAEAGAFHGGLASVETPGSGLFDHGSRRFYIDKSGNEVVPRDPKSPPPAVAAGPSERIARELNQKGKEADDLKDKDRAFQYYTQAIQADPRFYQAYFNRGSILGERKRWDAAIADFSAAIALSPQLHQAYQNRAICFVMKGNLDKALSDFNKAIQYNSLLDHAYFGRILVYIAQEKFDLARQEVTRLQQRGVAVPYRITSVLRRERAVADGSSTDLITVDDRLAPMRPKNLRSAEKVSGLFVGISNYPGRAPQSGPAHTFGAVLFHEIFYRSEANRLGLKIERSGTGSFISQYKSAPGEQIFTTKGGGGWFTVTAMFGRLPQPEIPNLKLIADLRINPRDYDTNPEAVVRLLASIDGSWLQLRDNSQVPVALSPPGLAWPYFGRGDYVSRQKLLTELEGTIDRAVQGMQQSQEVFVFYVAAHGGIQKDGKPFLFTANPDQSEERVGYQEILELIAQKGRAAQGKRLIKIIIFDTCQTLDEDVRKSGVAIDQTIASLQLPSDTVLITSTSPGRYAMHLPSAIRESHSVAAEATGLFGEKEESSFDQEFTSTSSAFPIASHLALKKVSGSPTITIEQWVSEIQQSLTSLIPADSAQDAQTVILRRSDPQVAQPVLFNVLKEGENGE